MYFASNDQSQNTFIYQPTIDKWELEKDTATVYVLSWKSKGVYNSKLNPLYTTFLNSIKLSDYKMGINLIKIVYLQNKTITQEKM